MDGIGYADSIIVYNRVVDGLMETETYYGTRFDGVRVELTQGIQVTTTGNQDADACVVKIPMDVAAGRYLPPKVWDKAENKEAYFTFDKDSKDFFVIVCKPLLGINVLIPTGLVDSDKYPGGYYQHICNTYGYAYQINHVDVYELIPRYEIGGG